MSRSSAPPRAALYAALASALALPACGGAIQAATPASALPSPAPAAARPVQAAPSADPLERRAAELGRTLAPQGVGRVEIVARGFLAERASETVLLRLDSGECATFVALASGGMRDLDAALYAPTGERLALDAEPDPHPAIQICSGPEAIRAYLHLLAYDGAGAFIVAALRSDRAAFAAVATALGGSPGVVEAGDPGGASPLRELSDGATRRGYREMGAPADVTLAEGQTVRIGLSAKRGECYLVAVFAAPPLRAVELRLLDELDGLIATDPAAGDEPAAQFCLERDTEVSVELRASAGGGSARVLRMRAAQADAGRTLWLGVRAPEQRASLSLRDRERALDAGRAGGWGRARPIASGRLAQGEAARHGLRLRRGRCTLLEVAGGAGLAGFEGSVFDARGRRIASAESESAQLLLRLCPERSEAVDVEIAARGGGAYSMRQYERPAPASAGSLARFDPAGLLEADEATRGAALREAVPPRPLAFDPSGELRLELPSTPGCRWHWLIAPRGSRLRAELRRAGRLAALEQGSTLRVVVCGEQGPASLHLRRSGPAQEALLLTYAREGSAAQVGL
ncbi:MAG: hypothetical protein OEY14_02245 [Myxococcales bacterium]|nr:hypothetical protein [Myxococcales bacterium]